MTWLIACEESGTIRDAMLARGIDAVSCDLDPTSSPGPHIQGDVLEQLGKRWAGIIAHPVCTFLTNAGAKHLYVNQRRYNPDGTENPLDMSRLINVHKAAWFYRQIREANAPRIAIENPVMHRIARTLLGKPKRQVVQPWWFGDEMFKGIGWELIGLPPLTPTNKLTPPKPGTDEHKRWSWVHRMPPGPDRTRLRSKTPPGMAAAIADQWGAYTDMLEAAE
jgi:hypothetical protein